MKTIHALALMSLFGTLACASTGRPSAAPTAPIAGAVAGFDTREYPGDATMQTWKTRSPYHWVGYYLEAPCRPGSTWAGKRATLAAQGWGLAVIFVGEQDWPQQAGETTSGQPGARCTRANLTAERGAADGAAADSAARADGFAAGSVIYLDVERVDSVSAPLRAYVGAWAQAVRSRGWTAGVYAHARNAQDLLAVLGADTPLWITSTEGFSLQRRPEESGIATARIWQGVLDTQEAYGGLPLRIDVNVARSTAPSGPQ